jgi:peptide/nickel transport system permease protein
VIGYVARRLAIGIVLLVIVSFVCFWLYFKLPINPAGMLVDLQRATPEEIAAAERALGVDKPVYVQYAKYVGRAVRGDFGYSWSAFDVETGRGAPVGPIVGRATKVTASLVLGGLVLVLLISIPLGAWLATRPRSFADQLVLLLSLAAISTHPLVVALLLKLFVATRWDIAPSAGYCPLVKPEPVPPDPSAPPIAAPVMEPCGGIVDWASHLALPWLTFALFFTALYIRMMRTQMIDVLEEPFVQTARAKGAPERRVISRHALRNAVAPLVTMTGMDAGMALGTALYVESVFQLPGLGRTTIAALAGVVGYDLPVLLGVVLVIGAAIVVMNLVADLVLLAVDPRTAREGAEGV